MTERITVNCQITVFHVADPPDGGVFGPHEWLAIATAHVYYAEIRPPGLKTHAEAILTGEVMRPLHGRGSAETELGAMTAALEVLLMQLNAYREASGGQ